MKTQRNLGEMIILDFRKDPMRAAEGRKNNTLLSQRKKSKKKLAKLPYYITICKMNEFVTLKSESKSKNIA